MSTSMAVYVRINISRLKYYNTFRGLLRLALCMNFSTGKNILR